MEKLNELLKNGVSRRKFLAGAGAGAGSLAVATLGAGCGSSSSPVTTTPAATLSPGQVTDENILNFALNLEYLEASYYQIGVNGTGLSAANMGSGAGTVTGGSQVTFATPAIQAYAAEIANDELLHVEFLRSALGSAAVSMPAIDFTNAFNNAAIAAGIVPAGGTFNPFADEASFLLGAFVFEDVGVTAYHGAAASITTPAYLAAAAGIMAVEAYHAGEVRTILTYLGDPYLTYANQISALRAAATNATVTGTTPATGPGAEVAVSGSTIVPTDANSIAFARTTDQVLNIVYLNAVTGTGAKSGGFFPNGLNGTITASAT